MSLDFSKHFLPNFSLAFMGALQKSKVASAFAFDLECQLNDGVDINLLRKYEKMFASSFERIRKENINKEIFVIPQINITDKSAN